MWCTVCVHIGAILSLPQPMWCWHSVCPHRSNPQPASNHVVLIQCVSPAQPIWWWPCGGGLMCVFIELLSTCLNPCGVDPMCVPIELLSTYLNSCGVDPMCVLIELLSTCLNPCGVGPVCLPCSTHMVVAMWCWSNVCPHRAIVNLPQPMWCWSNVCLHRAIVNLPQPM